MPHVDPCPRHPECLTVVVESPYQASMVHLSRQEARALAHRLYYAAADDDFADLDAPGPAGGKIKG